MSHAEDIQERAADFVIRRDNAEWSPEDQAEFDAWIAESIEHKVAFWRLEHAWSLADRIAALGPQVLPRPRQRANWWRGKLVAASLLIGVMLLLGLALSLKVFLPGDRDVEPPTAFRTAIGATEVAALPDGSRVQLNTSTAIRASVTVERREVWLDRGEAYFEVAHDRSRPFVVHAGPRTITVLGTKFSVRLDGQDVQIAVMEGRVRVDGPASANSAAAGSYTLASGEMAAARAAETLVTSRSPERVEDALMWREGMVTFEQSTLADVAAEFNRYNRRRIVIADSETGAIRIGGTFQASNVDGFVRLLERLYGLHVERGPDQVTVSR